MRCDVASAVSNYMRYLQLLDIKLIEQRPYIVLMPNVSEDDVSCD